MKKLLTFSFMMVFALWSVAVSAQDKPAPSPFSKVEQKVGLTDVTIEYSRPSMKGRTVMGSLVPYEGVWRTGANGVTKVTFSDDVTIEGKALAAGTYALLTTPGAESWGVHFHKYGERGAGSYKGKEPAVMAEVKPVKIDCTVETFLINIDELRDNSATLELVWENTVVPISLGVK